jgi:hypothetical protein
VRRADDKRPVPPKSAQDEHLRKHKARHAYFLENTIDIDEKQEGQLTSALKP